MLQFAQIVQMQGLLFGRWGVGNVLVERFAVSGVAVFKADTPIEIKRQVAHDSIEVADWLSQWAEVFCALAKTQPSILHHILCFGTAAHNGCGIVHQGMPMREVELEPFVAVGHKNPGTRVSDLKESGY